MEENKMVKILKNESNHNESSEVEFVQIDAFKKPLVKYKNKFYPPFFQKPSSIKLLELRPDDTFVIGYGKSGTTWMEEIVWLIQNNLNFKEASEKIHFERVYFIDMCLSEDSIKKLTSMTTPRVFKSHLSIELLPDDMVNKSKVVFITRNPKDMLVSYYEFTKAIENVETVENFDGFIQMSVDGKLPYGSWWELVNQYKSIEGIFFVTYEELLEKPFETIKSLIKYLEKSYSDEEIMKLIEFTSFDKMKSSPSFSTFDQIFIQNREKSREKFSFFRKGQIGSWVEHFNEENSKKIDDIVKRKLNKDIEYQYLPTKSSHFF